MNRIEEKFKELKKQRKKAFIAFITAGDPSLKATADLVVAFEKAGVDIVELGVPFSDPMADGPTIQASSQRALKKGATIDKILKTVAAIRKKSNIPIALMTYFNPVFHGGEKKFVRKAKESGVDGLIIPDLPPEEAKELRQAAKKMDLVTPFFIAPTTAPKRVKTIAKASTGFIYYVSLTGVTGARTRLPATLRKQLKVVKGKTNKPVCVGFGVSSSKQIRLLKGVADGVIVGSAIINQIDRNKGKRDLVKNVSKFVKQLSSAL